MLKKQETGPKKNWKSFLLNIVSPAILAVALFNLSIFALIIPAMKKNIVDRKKETIKELTLALVSEFADLHKQEKNGLISRKAAQRKAIEQANNMRYGSESKDYFWVTDMAPNMIVHPYRGDLNGKDVSKYADPAGKRLFSEFVKIVRQSGEGYVDYLWQWKDDSTRIVPKLSYVREFKPWGWVVGTGIYLEDVREEVSRLIRRVIQISVVISIVLALLLFYIARSGFNVELRRFRAEVALKRSEEQYRLLVEANKEGVVLAVDDVVVFANQTLLQLLGYSSQEIAKLTLCDIVVTEDAPAMPGYMRIRKKSGELIEVVASSSEAVFAGQSAHIYSFRDVGERKKTEINLSQILSEMQSALLLPNSPIKKSATRLVECAINTSIKNAAGIMTDAGARFILVYSAPGEHIGIVTDTDMRTRALLGGIDASRPVSTIMTSPVVRISERALQFEATLLLQEKGIHHLAVVNDAGAVVGVISADDVLQSQRHPASIILGEIKAARHPDVILANKKNLPTLLKAMLDNGARAGSITRILSSVSDAMITRFIELAIEKLGSPPTRFSFVVFGSEARGEQTLRTDQDNGIIYEDPRPELASEVQGYFLRLGEMVCGWLNDAGYTFCGGGVMAKNPKWCQPLSRWQQYFSDCVVASNPQDLLDVNVFFDFRSVYGEKGFVSRLRRHLGGTVEGRHAFFFHLAQSTLQYKPPLGFFGNIRLEENQDNVSTFNIKSAIIPIVNFARIYALRHGIDETGTLSRLQGLLSAGVLVESSHLEIAQAFSFLTQMRLVHQSNQISLGKLPDNFILPDELTQIDQSLLKKIFSDILVFQAKVSRDFARTEG
ncbi:MAG: hypothetical protein A2583_11755 [Bdellovibrionales bacterium RIFOXYD1_FULL_53_11]|nr:MAG: hypothetical protein A2583_11755 [Bdellovibrionales bacterium RIFOXYD1_FULL_53_11]